MQIPRLDEASVDLRALGLCLVVVVVTTIFFGLVPALLLLQGRWSTDLKSGERGSSRGARRIYSVLVAGEVALACALLVSSALLVRTCRQHDGHADRRQRRRGADDDGAAARATCVRRRGR